MVRIICLLFLIAGLVASGYLLQRHLQLATEDGVKKSSVCRVLLNSDCDGALKSSYSSFLGVPIAGWGVVYFGMTLVLIGASWFCQVLTQEQSSIIGIVFSCIGTGIGVWLTSTMLLGWSPLCPICLFVHFINLNLIFVFKLLSKKSWKQIFKSLQNGQKQLTSGQTLSAKSTASLVSLFSVVLCGAIIFQWVLILQIRNQPKSKDPRLSVAAFATTSRIEIPVTDQDARLGSSEAEVQIVVFSDLQCKACQRFARELEFLAKTYESKVSVVFKHFPLSSQCNNGLKNDPHPNACPFAQVSEIARRQGKFWEFHDAVFGQERDIQSLDVKEVAEQIQLVDVESDLQERGDEISQRIQDDIALGLKLGVDETPAVFIGGRRARDIRTETINFLIISEMANRSTVPISQVSDYLPKNTSRTHSQDSE